MTYCDTSSPAPFSSVFSRLVNCVACSCMVLAILAVTVGLRPLPAAASDPAKDSSAQSGAQVGSKAGSQTGTRNLDAPRSADGKAAKKTEPGQKVREREGTMSTGRMDEIIRRLDAKVKLPRPGVWQLTVSERQVLVIADVLNNRMRILSPIGKTADMPDGLLKRMMQANFDTALDARYAIGKGLVWATFIHPLKALHDRQFISAIGQTVNLTLTFGKTFSSGAMSYGGGDSRGIIRKQLIEKLMKKGLPI